MLHHCRTRVASPERPFFVLRRQFVLLATNLPASTRVRRRRRRYVRRVRTSQLTIEQARKLREQVAARLRYLNKLVERVTKLGFAPGDVLYDAAIRAQAAVHELHVKAHYAGIQHRVGKAAEGGWPESVVRRA